MNKCLNCSKETTNPKFCSRSCAGIYNNKKYPKRGSGEQKYCKYCGKELLLDRRRNDFCDKTCYYEYRKENRDNKNYSQKEILDFCKKHGETIFKRVVDKNGFRYRCKKCSKNMVANRRRKLKEEAIKYLGGKCSICGYNKSNRALNFHHINPEEKEFGISAHGWARSWDRIKKELDKCVLLCANCHAEEHDRLEESIEN